MSTAYQYRVGGHLPIDAPSYVVRAADRQFYAGLKAGELCYVLNSRQMGKTSLRFRTMHLLQQAGVACVAIDLQGIGSHNITPQQWYAGLVKRLVQGLNLNSQVNVRSWWQEREVISPVQRFSEFVEVVLPKFIDRQITIFIDEIDSTLSLDFDTDDFFAAVRACSEFQQINFALIGVATPGDLIKDVRRSPFNIGKAIELRGFQDDEIQPLLSGLTDKAMRPEVVLSAILDWTGGQPFLTQKLCKLIQELDTPLPGNYEIEFVESLVRSQVITNWETKDEPEHLKTIRNYLVHSNQQHAQQSLHTYQQILTEGVVTADNSPAQLDLRLSGLVVKKNDQLEICNRIYAQVFDRQWLEKVLSGFSSVSIAPVKQRKILPLVALAISTLTVIFGAIFLSKPPQLVPQVQNPPDLNKTTLQRQEVKDLLQVSQSHRLKHRYQQSLLIGVKAAIKVQQIQSGKQALKMQVRENLWEILIILKPISWFKKNNINKNSGLPLFITKSCLELQGHLKNDAGLSAADRVVCDGVKFDH
jgi:AAA-like domain